MGVVCVGVCVLCVCVGCVCVCVRVVWCVCGGVIRGVCVWCGVLCVCVCVCVVCVCGVVVCARVLLENRGADTITGPGPEQRGRNTGHDNWRRMSANRAFITHMNLQLKHHVFNVWTHLTRFIHSSIKLQLNTCSSNGG